MSAAKKLTIVNNIAEHGYREDDPVVHMHVIPRHEGDGLHLWGSQEYKEGEMARIAEKIRNSL